MDSKLTDQELARLLTYQELAKLLGIKVNTLYTLVSQRRIPHVRIGSRLVRFDRRQIERWLTAKRVIVDEKARKGATS